LQSTRQQTTYDIYSDKTSVPLNLNPNQVQNIEDRYLARRSAQSPVDNPYGSYQSNSQQA